MKLLVVLAVCLLGTARGQTTPPVNPIGQNLGLAQHPIGQLGQQLQSLLSGTVGRVQQGLSGVATQGAQWSENIQTQYASLAAQLDVLEAQYEATYCTPARFEQSVKKPAKFVGQSFAITFDTGACSFDDKKFLHEHKKELNCTQPAITHIKIPANFTSKFHSAPKFVNKECAVAKVFGDTYSQVLFVFDGKSKLDVNTLSTKITQEVKNLLSGIAPKTGNPNVGLWTEPSWNLGAATSGLGLGQGGLLQGGGLFRNLAGSPAGEQ